MADEHGVDPAALHEESYETGRDDARAGRPDRAFEVTVDAADRAAYEAGRSDAYKIDVPTWPPPYDPNPAPTMSPITKDEEERDAEYTRRHDEAQRWLKGEDGEMPHAEYGHVKPGEVDPATGRPVPYPTVDPGVDPAAE